MFILGTQWESLSTRIVAQLPSSFTEGKTATASTTAAPADVEVAAIEPFNVTFETALACLRLTTPGLDGISYPTDAEAHFLELNRTLASFLPESLPMHRWIDYAGPWVENYWINSFNERWLQRPNGTRLKDLFGPFIPIFFPFADARARYKGYPFYPAGLVQALNASLRRNCLYVTVSQHDEGVFGMPKGAAMHLKDRIRLTDFPNLLVLSAGGYGHVPLPLLKRPEKQLPLKPMASRPYFTSFIGSKNGGKMRIIMSDIVEKWARNNSKEVSLIFRYVPNWKEITLNSSIGLAPRGWGRSSFRTSELLRMGRVPVYIWNDEPWMFYRELWEKELIGFSSQLSGLTGLLDRINSNLRQVEAMEERIRGLRDSHFSYEGVMDQISKFLTGGSSDLRCQSLPKRIN